MAANVEVFRVDGRYLRVSFRDSIPARPQVPHICIVLSTPLRVFPSFTADGNLLAVYVPDFSIDCFVRSGISNAYNDGTSRILWVGHALLGTKAASDRQRNVADSLVPRGKLCAALSYGVFDEWSSLWNGPCERSCLAVSKRRCDR